MNFNNIFAYGELTKDERLFELINRIPKKFNAEIHGFEKFFDKKIGYYGIRKLEKSSVKGVILFEINSKELKILDEYEDEGIYYLKNETVAFDEFGKSHDVIVYVRLE